jgi:hypothetical protein
MARHRQENVGSYALVYDFRRLTGHPSVEDLKAFMCEDKDRPSEGACGPVAIVALRGPAGEAIVYGVPNRKHENGDARVTAGRESLRNHDSSHGLEVDEARGWHRG